MPKLYIYERDPTGGTCGFPAEIPGLPSADFIRQELIRRNKIVKQIESTMKIEVKRIFLKNAGFAEGPLVKSFLRDKGSDALPIFIYKGTIIYHGNFPEFEILCQKINGIES